MLAPGAVPVQVAGPVEGAAGRKDWRKYRRRAEEEEAGSVGERGSARWKEAGAFSGRAHLPVATISRC